MDLSQLRDELATLPALEKKITPLNRAIWDAENELSGLLQELKKESRDVERIQESSLSSFLLKLVGKYEDKLEKEQQEEISAKLRYDSAAARVANLTNEKKSLSSRISDLRAMEQEYKSELTKIRAELSSCLTEPDGIKLNDLERERSAIVSQQTEIREAKFAAAQAISTAQRALSSLESAQGWATYDAFARGGIITHMAKYSHIDDAESDFNLLSSQLSKLKAEIRDVRDITVSGLTEISSTQRAVDFWFDNIFTDLSVRGQIKNNVSEITRLLSSLRSAENALDARLRSEDEKLAENKRREEELLISVGFHK